MPIFVGSRLRAPVGSNQKTVKFVATKTERRRKSKDRLVRKQDVSEWSDMSTHGLLLQWAKHYNNPTMRVALVQSRHHYHLIECNLVLAMI